MRRLTRIFTLLGCIIVGISVAGTANAFVFDMGGGSWVDTSGTDSALKLYAVMNPKLDNVTFDLEVGQTSDPIFFARIGSSEKWINSDDVLPGVVSAHVDFDSPNLTETINGVSHGFAEMCRTIQGWELTWSDPLRIITASGLDFSIDLSDGFWSGDYPKGTDKIFASVTLNAVPVPAPLLLLGTGLIGLVGVRRKKRLMELS